MLGAPELEGGQRAGEYAEEEVSLSRDLTARLNEIGRECGITLNTIAQGVWALLLSRYSGEPEVVFGSIVSGRPPELEGADKMVGVFINTLPLRVQINRSRARNEWLEALQIDQAEREQYAYSSLIDIQRWSEIPPGSPLFESILIFENYPIEDSLLQGAGGLSITQVHAHDPNNYPVTLVVTPARQAGPDVVISLKVMYDDGRFDRATIQRLIGHYECLMDNLARSPEPFVGEADILTEAERTQTLCDWRSPEVPLPKKATFVDRFEDNADRFAGRCAVQMEGLALSYRELDDWADRLADRLMSARTVFRGDRIAVLMHRSPAIVASILAIWKCRAAYVPIDPDFPFERIKTVLVDSGSVLAIAGTDHVAGRFFEAGLDIGVVTVGDTEREPGPPKSELDSMLSIAQVTGENSARLRPSPDDAAYVIYTSGSTGRPKGAIIEHRGMLNHLLAMMSELELGPDSIVAQTASHCFDISMWQFFAALLAGGRTSIYPDRTVVNPAALVDLIEQDQVEVVQFVPSYLAVFLDELELRNDSLIFSRLKWLVTIGETLKPAYVRRWFDLFEHVKLMNAYGPTEASDSVTHHVMDRRPSSPGIPIGRPIQNIHIYVLDPQMNLCPIGIKGEICIGGVGVGRGYLGDPERTRDSFASDRFSGEPGARLYKTGDIGCFGPDGNLFFFGRKDHQVKIRGHRLELGEVERALAGVNGVRACAVIGRERQGQTTLCAFVSLRDDSRLQSSDLKVALSERLPAYMVPDAIRILPDLPLNSSGKIDRKRLPGIEESDLNTIKSPSPITKTQHDVADIWKDVLGAEH
ncbi:MAG: non-ribosomal peptide synthetase, partial [Blastocatellia bacterium]